MARPEPPANEFTLLKAPKIALFIDAIYIAPMPCEPRHPCLTFLGRDAKFDLLVEASLGFVPHLDQLGVLLRRNLVEKHAARQQSDRIIETLLA